MRHITVDPERHRVRAEGGCTWGDLNRRDLRVWARHHRRSHFHDGDRRGLTLGGGIGFLARRCGLACDNLVSAEVVTADGELLTCSEDENDDLFWALRGGGGNFGVVTSFEYRLHAVDDVIGGPTVFALDADVLSGFDDFMAQRARGLRCDPRPRARAAVPIPARRSGISSLWLS